MPTSNSNSCEELAKAKSVNLRLTNLLNQIDRMLRKDNLPNRDLHLRYAQCLKKQTERIRNLLNNRGFEKPGDPDNLDLRLEILSLRALWRRWTKLLQADGLLRTVPGGRPVAQEKGDVAREALDKEANGGKTWAGHAPEVAHSKQSL